MNEIGEMLCLARESSGVSLAEASKDLNIKVQILENIEAGHLGAFKDIFELKEYITNYGKYLGLDTTKMIDEFNEYMFEYTSKIPVKEIEKTIVMQQKEEKDTKDSIISPYTKEQKKYSSLKFILIYVFLIILVLLAIIWSVKEITINTKETQVISYRR